MKAGPPAAGQVGGVCGSRRMKVLFTGATSLAGSEWCRQLLRDGHHVSVVSRQEQPTIPTVHADLCSEGAEAQLPDERFDVLIHFASYVPSDEKNSTWEVCAPTNVDGTIRLLRWAEGRVGRIVLASSCAVYGAVKLYTPTDERHPLWPDTDYALSKYAQEQVVQAFCVSRAIPFVTMRLGYVYGPGVRSERAIVKLLHMVQAGKPITLTNATTAGLHLIHTRDIAHIGTHLMQQGCGAYNVVSGRHISLLEYVRTAMEVTGSRCEVTSTDDPEARVTNWYSIDWLMREGIQPQVSLREGIATLLDAAEVA